ncbi:OmpH family outer membrane protein [Pedobacter cryotolerans]|jgi:outer membrane protein|uniref:OmpH family outer membrane protein n=1 Tax=Pedobacter cryotolerans TaxID=2571270 RepID=A0A4U1C2Q2_9SPHI|nr:OmpH family outer membrane protein [Pedobacter cryotolerans]TKB99416.1 OmpH family outer membrane protein [Pedobacter cryotolerans]
MKLNTLKVSSLATAIALVSVLTACGDKESKTDTSATKTTTTVTAENEIVYVNSDTLLSKYQYAKDITAKMESKGKAAESDLVAKGQAFQREVQQYQAQANSLAADQRAATEQRLQRKDQELKAYQQNAGTALQNENAKEQEALYNKIADYLKTYSKSKGYKMVLTYSKGNANVLFADESLDVTNAVVKGLNDAYAKDKK